MADETRKNEIYAELSRLKEAARQLREIAQNLTKLARDEYSDGLNAVKDSWSGDNAQTFLGKAQKTGTDMADTAGKIQEAADTLETIAKAYADAELKAIEVAKS